MRFSLGYFITAFEVCEHGLQLSVIPSLHATSLLPVVSQKNIWEANLQAVFTAQPVQLSTPSPALYSWRSTELPRLGRPPEYCEELCAVIKDLEVRRHCLVLIPPSSSCLLSCIDQSDSTTFCDEQTSQRLSTCIGCVSTVRTVFEGGDGMLPHGQTIMDCESSSKSFDQD